MLKYHDLGCHLRCVSKASAPSRKTSIHTIILSIIHIILHSNLIRIFFSSEKQQQHSPLRVDRTLLKSSRLSLGFSLVRPKVSAAQLPLISSQEKWMCHLSPGLHFQPWCFSKCHWWYRNKRATWAQAGDTQPMAEPPHSAMPASAPQWQGWKWGYLREGLVFETLKAFEACLWNPHSASIYSSGNQSKHKNCFRIVTSKPKCQTGWGDKMQLHFGWRVPPGAQHPKIHVSNTNQKCVQNALVT